MDRSTGYEAPRLTDLGWLGAHTFYAAGREDQFKGGITIRHLDKHCEWSGGTDPDWTDPNTGQQYTVEYCEGVLGGPIPDAGD